MAQLNSSVVQGSLRVTDTTYTNDLIISNTTAPIIATNDYLLLADNSDSNKILKGPVLNTSNTTKWLTQAGTWTTPTAANVGALPSNTVVNKVKQSSNSTSAAYKVLFSTTASPTSGSDYETYYGSLTYNPNTKALVTGGTIDGFTLAPQTTGFKISGGTTSKTLTVGADYTLAAACAYGVDDATANGALGTGTGLTTERSVYYGLVTVNNASQTRATGIYAPTSAGTANQILVSAGGTSAPTWKATADGAAYATSANGELTFGILPIAQGGTSTSGRADGEVLIGKSETSGSTTTNTLEWRVLKGSDLTTAIQYKTDEPTSTDVVPGTIWLRPTSVSIEDLKCLVVQLNNISGDGSQPVSATYNSTSINQHMVVVGYSISNPAAVTGDLTWTTSDANPTLTVQGYINGNTNIILYLLPERGE